MKNPAMMALPVFGGTTPALAQEQEVDCTNVHCGSKTYADVGANGQAAEYISCQEEMTIERTKELKTLYEDD